MSFYGGSSKNHRKNNILLCILITIMKYLKIKLCIFHQILKMSTPLMHASTGSNRPEMDDVKAHFCVARTLENCVKRSIIILNHLKGHQHAKNIQNDVKRKNNQLVGHSISKFWNFL